jgi:F0F1-type ATP synthase membrane subunit b/b'
MKKLAVIFLGLLLLPWVFASCEYVDIERYTQTGEALCLEGSTTFYAQALIISDFSNGTRPSFTITNPNDYPIKAFFNYSIKGSINSNKFYGIAMKGKDRRVIQDICLIENSFGNCSIEPSSVTYFVTDPRSMDQCRTEIPMTKDICNRPCTKDSDCSEAKCNIAGFCGPQKIVPCPTSKTNCNNIACVTPGQKQGGESYLCQFECASGIGEGGVCKGKDGAACQKDIDCHSGVCNAAHQCGEVLNCPEGKDNCRDMGCFTPATQGYNEPYLCEWQCDSERGLNGVCQLSTTTFITSLGILVLLYAILVWHVYYNKRKKEKERLDIIQSEIRNAEQKLAKDASQLQRLENSLAKLSDREVELKHKVATAEGDTKKLLEEELAKHREHYERQMNVMTKTFEERSSSYREQLAIVEQQITELHLKEKDARKRMHSAHGEALAKVQKEFVALREKDKKLQILRSNIEQGERDIANRKERLAKESREMYIREQTEKYKNKYDSPSVKVFYDSHTERIKIKFKDGKEKFLHRFIYESKVRKLDPGEHVHHIDYDELNNELSNLIALTNQQHSKIEHIKNIDKREWSSGIRELKRALNLEDNDLPPHIQAHLKVQ